MFVAAAEDSGKDLINGRGDAYCGLLSASYNIGLRRLRPYIPEYPVGDPEDIAAMLAEFIPVARTVIGVRNLKIISFGPRPFDFLTCHAPIQPLYDLGVEIMENSELDLLDLVQAEKGESRSQTHRRGRWRRNWAQGNTYPDLIEKLAQYECALEKFMQANLGASQYAAFANKCWPAFEKYFGHVPCYMNSRLAAKGIPVACEADIYGALSEYMSICATELPPAHPGYQQLRSQGHVRGKQKAIGDYALSDLWMGFHCGNTSSACLMKPSMQYQLIMHRLHGAGAASRISRAERWKDRSRPARSPSSASNRRRKRASRPMWPTGKCSTSIPGRSAPSACLPIREMGRFYRHVLIEKTIPASHGHCIQACRQNPFCRLQDARRRRSLLQSVPRKVLYPTENPF